MKRQNVHDAVVKAFEDKYLGLGREVADEFLMSCLPPESKIITERGFIPISEVRVGERVLTHKGRFQRVTHVFKRPYTGEILKITTYGCPEPLRVTPEHPILSCKTKRIRYLDGKFVARTKLLNEEWIPARQITTKNKVLFPIINKDSRKRKLIYSNNYASIYGTKQYKLENKKEGRRNTHKKIPFNQDYATIVGFYLSEGYIQTSTQNHKKYDIGVCFAFGKNKKESDYADQVVLAAKKLGFNSKVRIKEGCYNVIIYSAGLARYLKSQFKCGAHNKIIPAWYCSLPNEVIKRTLECYLFGDGHHIIKKTNTGVSENCWKASTVSEKLAYGMYLLAPLVGYRVGIQKRDGRNSFKSQKKASTAYVISINMDEQKTDGRITNEGKYVYLGIRSIGSYDYDGLVYNLEVEQDNSFCHLYHAVHNCASFNIQEHNKPDFRIRRHLCLYWAPGWIKSTLLMKFYDILGPDLCMCVSDLSLATLRGSVECGKFIAPACMKKPFAVATEFGQMVNPDQQELVQKLLNVLEEGVVTVNLVKIAQLDPVDHERIQAEYPSVRFLDSNTFTYKTNWILFAGTYNKKYLVDNALESRFNIVSPTQYLNNKLVKHINTSDPFSLDDRVAFELRELIHENSEVSTKVKLPEEIYSESNPLTVRDSAQLISYVMCKNWWGIKVSKDDIISLADKYKNNSLEIWMTADDKVFKCLENGEPKTIDEIVTSTNLSKRTAYTATKKLGLSAYRDDGGKKVFSIR